MARSAGGLWALHDLLQPVRSLANGWHLGLAFRFAAGFAFVFFGSVSALVLFKLARRASIRLTTLALV
jgi:hypothetical protein